ncbi:Ku protein [Kitasatospora sp. NPDC057936]|uniref:Ku protein n=1 Tax=Kitasatospora sp. NPDC057936 TaxID=3346283 RepID=UPI0036DC34CB
MYALLVEALAHAGKAGLAMFAMRGKEYLTAVRSENGLLELHTMHFADEVRDPRTEVGDLPEKVKLSPKEVETAEQLIGMLAVDWDPGQWHDTYEEQVKKLVQDKLAGREIAVSTGPAPQATNVVDLMDALRRSLEGARKGESAGETEKKPPARARRSPKPAAGTKSTSAKAITGKKTAAKRASAAGKRQLSQLTKAELYQRAADLDIPHRSTMSRDQLQQALESTARPRAAS